jgi:hypothetical protein
VNVESEGRFRCPFEDITFEFGWRDLTKTTQTVSEIHTSVLQQLYMFSLELTIYLPDIVSHNCIQL